jgi:hypothetical protein
MHRLLRPRRNWAVIGAAGALAAAIAIPATSFADSPGGCDFQQAGVNACSQPLTGSTFAGGDGNLLTTPTTYGTTDWENVAGLNKGIDLPSGQTDNSFGQGTKEDDPNVSVVTGSIPPNKSDLTRFYEASELAGGNNYLYLAWERTNILGSANFDFEINQNSQPDLTKKGAATLNRTAGDLLVTFDFTNGGGKPTIGLLFWVTSGAPSQCKASNTVPCWGNEKTLDGTQAIGAVNTDTVTDPISPNAPRPLSGLTFGETAINLNAAGVFTNGSCEAFGSAMVRSRSSASFTAEIKDFIAPIPVHISDCGEVKIIKQTDPRGLNQDFGYTSDIPNPATGSSSPSCTTDSTPSSFTLNDNGNSGTANSTGNTEDCTNLAPGTYHVTEGAEPDGFSLKSLNCSPSSGDSNGAQDAVNKAKADITVAAGGVVTCTYVNQATGAIVVTKNGKDAHCTTASTTIAATEGTCYDVGKAHLAGASFDVGGTPASTDKNGKVCFDGLTLNTAYTVTEDAAPTGYGIDTSTKSVTPTAAATCTPSGTPATVTFTDTPLTDLAVSATSETTGLTKSSISCTDSSGNVVASVGTTTKVDPASVTKDGLGPDTYTCTIVIDP